MEEVFVKNFYEAQGRFLDAIQDMIDHDEIYLEVDEQFGFESLVEQFKIMSTKIEYRDAEQAPVQDSKILHLNKKGDE